MTTSAEQAAIEAHNGRLFYSDPPRLMSLGDMGDLLFDLTARCVDLNGHFAGESWVWFRLQDAEGLESVGRFIDRLKPHAAAIAEMLRAEGGRR